MNWHHVALEQITPLPWKNGGGTTRVLAAWPQADDWRWRMSVAQVASDGPFSRFPGVVRWFAVLNGAGVILDVAGTTHTLTQDTEPLRFDGAVHTDCRLIDGPTQDFNLMLNAPAPRASMQWLSGVRSFKPAPGDCFAVYALTDGTEIDCSGEVQRVLPETLAWCHAEQHDTLHVVSKRALTIHICGKPTE